VTVAASNQASSDEVVVFAHRYLSAAASRVEFENFSRFLDSGNINGTSVYRIQNGEHGWIIAVADQSGNAQHFGWAGEPHELRQQEIDGLIARALTQGKAEIDYGESIAPRVQPDGTWTMPKPQG
jgi:hypothetical protein